MRKRFSGARSQRPIPASRSRTLPGISAGIAHLREGGQDDAALAGTADGAGAHGGVDDRVDDRDHGAISSARARQRRPACSRQCARVSGSSIVVSRPSRRTTRPPAITVRTCRRVETEAGVTGQVLHGQRRGRRVVEDDHVVAARRVGMVHLEVAAPVPQRLPGGGGRESARSLTAEVGSARAAQHVSVQAVGAEQDARRVEVVPAEGADAIVLVALGVVADPGRRVVQQAALALVQVQAVHEEAARQVEDAGRREALDDAQAVVGDAAALVDEVLGDVDVDADAVLAGEGDGEREKVVADGERRVQTDHGRPAAAQVRGGLVEARARGGGAVAVGQLEAEDVRETEVVQGAGDGGQRAADGARRGVMVDDARHATAHGVDAGGERAGADHLAVEAAVETPPDQFQDLGEVTGRAGRGRHAAREARVEMVMAAHETRQREAAAAVDHVVAG